MHHIVFMFFVIGKTKYLVEYYHFIATFMEWNWSCDICAKC